MSVERDLISRILQDRDLTVVTDAGVTPAFFQKPENREAYKYILEHHRQYSQVPSVEAFGRNYPTYKVSDAPDTIQYYADTLGEYYEEVLVEDGLVKATDAYDSGDIKAARQHIADLLRKVNQEVTRTKVTDITETGNKRLERYREYSKAGGALKGIPTGFSILDYATGGMQPGQLFTHAGPQKVGKSTGLILNAMAAHRAFYKPLFIGFEMSNQEQEERHDAIRAGVSSHKLQHGTLTREEFQAVERMMRRNESMPAMYFSEDASSARTLSGIIALYEKFRPDVIYVDGVYMMEDEEGEKKGSPQALTNISRGFKIMAKNLHIPIAISTQVLEWKMDRKRGVTTSSIGYTTAFGQDSDVLVGYERTDDEDIKKVKILDGRNVKRLEWFVQWDWDTGQFIELEGGDEEPVEDNF